MKDNGMTAQHTEATNAAITNATIDFHPKPTVGRQVMFRSGDKRVMTATITGINADDTVNLVFFSPRPSDPVSQRQVGIHQQGADRTQLYVWFWPERV